MKVIKECLGCKLLEIRTLTDNRGWFQVVFCPDDLLRERIDFRGIEQLNQSMTEIAGVIHGSNYQESPFNQAKLVRCTRGRLYSVAVDIDKESPSYMRWYGFEQSTSNQYIMYTPRTYANGFVTMENCTKLEYFTDNKYSFQHAKSIRYDDPDIEIDWSMKGVITVRKMIMSEKNLNTPYLRDISK